MSEMLTSSKRSESAESAITAARGAMFNHRILTRAEERSLAQRYERGDMDAKDELICCNLKLAKSQAIKYVGRCQILTVDDLFIAAVDGLCRAAEKFDWRLNIKFSTYAMNWIRQRIQREIDDRENAIRIPVHLQPLKREIADFVSEFNRTEGRRPSDDEIASALGVSVHEIDLLRTRTSIDSLDRPVGEEGDTTLAEFIDTGAPDVADLVIESAESSAVAAAIESLPEQHRAVLTERFINNRGLREAARLLGIERIDVRKIERDAMRELRGRLGEAAA